MTGDREHVGTVLDAEVTIEMLRKGWGDVLALAAGRSKKCMSILREATMWGVQGRTLTLAFPYPAHATMLQDSPEVALMALSEVFGGEWQIVCQAASRVGLQPAVSADPGTRPLCERFGGKDAVQGNKLGRYLDVGLVGQLPAEVTRPDLQIRHGYAVGIGAWFFFADLPPALAFGRAARMSEDCSSYGVYRAAMEVRHCLSHGDEYLLYAITGAPSLDRTATEVAHLETWVQGVKSNPRSAYWHPPVASPASVPVVIAPAAAPTSSGKRCAVYLHYDADGILLYVGLTDEIAVRGRSHARKSSWALFAVRGEHVWCDDRRAAERKEVELIKTLRPLFNDKHSAPDRNERLVAYLAGKGRYDLLSPAITRG